MGASGVGSCRCRLDELLKKPWKESAIFHMRFVARVFLFLGAVNAVLVVALGAFGAHALKGQLSAEQAALFQTALQYHMFHALGLLAVGVVAARRPGSILLAWAGGVMFMGIVFFCGSLYVTAITDYRGLVMTAPFGGTAFMVAWVLFGIAVLRR
jgi:uncharacterized membrane protein YgdD (TMEM256/DUF423 family)